MPKIFFDVGANNGYSSLGWIHPNRIIYAFEPTPELSAIIRGKIVDAGDYYKLITKAVSDFNGTATFNVAGHGDWGCSSLLEFSDNSKTEWPGRTDFNVTEQITVEVIRLDSFIEENNIEQIDYLHIDTQGSDLNVLKGLGKYISIVQEGVMEAAAKTDALYFGQNTKDECIEFLKNNGFEITNVEINDGWGHEVNIHFKRPNVVSIHNQAP